MGEAARFAREAGEQYRSATELARTDAMQNKLRYHLLRLTEVGLAREDLEGLGELARLAFEEADQDALAGQATVIRERSGVSSLALAIADIVERAGEAPGRGDLRTVMLGALLGAYSAIHVDDETRFSRAITAATGGASAASTLLPILDQVTTDRLHDYLSLND